jgi:hypothetical protein
VCRERGTQLVVADARNDEVLVLMRNAEQLVPDCAADEVCVNSERIDEVGELASRRGR